MAEPALILLPGLGADRRLFTPQLDRFETASVPDWIERHPGDTLGSFAQRLAGTLDLERPHVLAGFSFGGMVALEIASRVPEARRPLSVVLLSGLRSRRAVTRTFKLQQAIGGLVPRPVVRAALRGPVTRAFAKREGLSEEQTATLRAMAAETDLDFLFWAARACARWDHDGVCPAPVRHLHGESDRIIPCVPHPELPGGEPELIEGAGHLITWTAADRVNGALARALAESAA
ncbi:MAG: alpha/beta fold hydrolase [Planctomycetota bacterium]